MRKLLLFVTTLLISSTTMARETTITSSQLPKKALEFIEKHYSKDKIAIATLEQDFFEKEYKTILTSGTSLEFDDKGEWKEIECKTPNTVPMEVINSTIAEYLKTNFPQNSVREISRSKTGFDLELNNDIELEFNKEGVIIEVDM